MNLVGKLLKADVGKTDDCREKKLYSKRLAHILGQEKPAEITIRELNHGVVSHRRKQFPDHAFKLFFLHCSVPNGGYHQSQKQRERIFIRSFHSCLPIFKVVASCPGPPAASHPAISGTWAAKRPVAPPP